MPLDSVTLDHICNVIRRDTETEFDDLSLFFLTYTPSDPEKQRHQKAYELKHTPGGAHLFTVLKAIPPENYAAHEFTGLNIWEERKWYFPIKKERATALFLIDSTQFETPEDAREHLMHLIWHALATQEHYKKQNTDKYKVVNRLIVPSHQGETEQAYENMLADIFSAVFTVLHDKKSSINALAKKRTSMALKPVKGYRAELYPFPIAAEATQIVYEEFSSSPSSRTDTRSANDMHKAIEITREVEYSFDEASVHQWVEFASAAQKMAWSGEDKNKILQLAIFSSEDPYIRSMAYLAAEYLNITPRPSSDTGTINHFTTQETNERLHFKLCERAFNDLMTQTGDREDITAVAQEKARYHNSALQQGNSAGWCVPALMDVARYDQETEDLPQAERPNILRDLFKNLTQQISWDSLLNLSLAIIEKKRNGVDITPETIIDLCEKEPDLEIVKQAFIDIPPAPEDATKPQKP